MNTRTFMTTLVAVIGLASCAQPTMMPSREVSTANCDTGPGARCTVAIRSGSTYSCGVGRFDVSPDVVQLRGGKPVNFFWELPDGFAFCNQDGVYLSSAVSPENRQVIETFGSDNADGSRATNEMVAKSCSSKWHWNYNNQGTDLYKYTIKFTEKSSGRSCVIDPWIKNG